MESAADSNAEKKRKRVKDRADRATVEQVMCVFTLARMLRSYLLSKGRKIILNIDRELHWTKRCSVRYKVRNKCWCKKTTASARQGVVPFA